MPTAAQWKPIDDPTNRRARCHSCVNRVAGNFVCSLFISEWQTNRQRHKDETRVKKQRKRRGSASLYTVCAFCIFNWEGKVWGERVYVTERKTEWESLLPSQWTSLVASPFTPGLVSTCVNPGNQWHSHANIYVCISQGRIPCKD